MTKVLNLVKRVAADEEGAALVEYTVLLGIMLVAVIATIVAVGGWVKIGRASCRERVYVLV